MMGKIIVWIKAARLKLHILGILPVLVGSLAAFKKTGDFNTANFIIAELITLFALVATAYANDYADVEGDRLNKNFTMFSGGSRAVVDGAVSRPRMLAASIVCACIAVALSLIFPVVIDGRMLVPVLTLAGLFIGVGYSLPPLKINYRGGGEFFVMVMYSIFCVYFGYVTQGLRGFDNTLLYLSVPFAIGSFLTILATEIPDYASDKLSGKKTIPVFFGMERSLALISICFDILVFGILAPAAFIALSGGGDRLFSFAGINNVVLKTAGVMLAAAGLALVIWAYTLLVRIGKGYTLEFFGFEILPAPKKLVTGGPYSALRHPMALGYLAILLGIAFLRGSISAAVIVFPVFAMATIVYLKFFEEKKLAERFKEEYTRWSRRA